MFESPKKFFSKEEQKEIVQAIGEAEENTSGEIRVHLVPHLKGDGLEEGKRIFEKIGMTRTRGRNGILFLLALKDHQLILLGDQGIHEKVGKDFWEEIKDTVLAQFRKSQFAQGLIEGIERCGEKLKEFFPYHREDENELSDQISH